MLQHASESITIYDKTIALAAVRSCADAFEFVPEKLHAELDKALNTETTIASTTTSQETPASKKRKHGDLGSHCHLTTETNTCHARLFSSGHATGVAKKTKKPSLERLLEDITYKLGGPTNRDSNDPFNRTYMTSLG